MTQTRRPDPTDQYEDEDTRSLLEWLIPLVQHRWLIIVGALVAGLAGLGATYLMTPTFTASTTFLPPQQQGGASSLLAALGPLAGLAGAAGGLKTPADQYVALMQSVTISDRLIERFGLLEVYDAKLREDARRTLRRNVRINAGKKDGIITVEVDDASPQRGADIANRYVEELRETTSRLAVTEAQQRRQFFETKLKETREQLMIAQQAMQSSGITQGALKSEPRAAADAYARLRAEVTSAEVTLQTLRGSLADATPEVRQQANLLAALRGQLARLEQTSNNGPDAGYVGKYREFKYQETLFDLYARQFELARIDESHEGALIQVVDAARPPERKSAPKRALISVSAAVASALALMMFVLGRDAWRRSAADPANAPQMARLRAALRRPVSNSSS